MYERDAAYYLLLPTINIMMTGFIYSSIHALFSRDSSLALLCLLSTCAACSLFSLLDSRCCASKQRAKQDQLFPRRHKSIKSKADEIPDSDSVDIVVYSGREILQLICCRQRSTSSTMAQKEKQLNHVISFYIHRFSRCRQRRYIFLG